MLNIIAFTYKHYQIDAFYNLSSLFKN